MSRQLPLALGLQQGYSAQEMRRLSAMVRAAERQGGRPDAALDEIARRMGADIKVLEVPPGPPVKRIAVRSLPTQWPQHLKKPLFSLKRSL